jgi:hypothetical protein
MVHLKADMMVILLGRLMDSTRVLLTVERLAVLSADLMVGLSVDLLVDCLVDLMADM